MTESELLNYFRKQLSKGELDDDFFQSANRVLEDQSSSSILKKLAAKGILAKNGQFSKEQLEKSSIFAAFIEVVDEQEFVNQLERYLTRPKDGDSLDDDALLVLTTFIQRTAKLKNVTNDHAKRLLFRTIRFVEARSEDLLHLLKICLKFLVKTENEKEEFCNLLFKEFPPGLEAKYYLLSMLISQMDASRIKLEKDELFAELLYCSEYQAYCSSASSFIMALALIFPVLIKELLKQCLLHRFTAVRVNVLRTWIGRMTPIKSNYQMLFSLIAELEEIVHAENISTDLWPPSTSNEYENLSSVSADWSWIESETPTSLRDRALYGALMVASGNIQNLLRTKSKQLSAILSSETLLAGLRWHQSNVRLLAIKVLVLLDDNPHLLCCLSSKTEIFDLKVELSSFVLDNCHTESDDLFQFIITLLPRIQWTEGQLQEWARILRSQSATEEALTIALEVLSITQSPLLGDAKPVLMIHLFHEAASVRHRAIKLLNEKPTFYEIIIEESARIYGPAHEVTLDLLKERTKLNDGYAAKFITRFQPNELEDTELLLRNPGATSEEISTSLVSKWLQRIDQLLIFSGSSSFPECPQFSELATNLASHNIKPFEFAHLILNYQKLVLNAVTFSNDENLKWKWANAIWQSIIRTRHKTIVDLGTELIPKMLKYLESSRTFAIFNQTKSLLFSVDAKTRTLTIAKTLWACCDLQKALFYSLWDEIETSLKGDPNPTVNARLLKVLKYFLAREQCPWTTSSKILNTLFEKCLSVVEKENDFLVRSSAVILFGFVTNLIINRKRVRFYFELLIDSRKTIVKTIYKTFEGKKDFGKEYRMLVLAFLAKFRFGSSLLYSESQIWFCNKLSDVLLNFLPNARDIRESRATLDSLAGLIPYVESGPLRNKLKFDDEGECFIEHTQKVYFVYTLEKMWNPMIALQSNQKERIPCDIAHTPYIRQIIEVIDAVEKNDQEKLCQLINIEKFHRRWELGSNTLGYVVAIASRVLKDGKSDFRLFWKKAAFEALSLSDHCARMAARSTVEMGLTKHHVQPEIARQLLREYFNENEQEFN